MILETIVIIVYTVALLMIFAYALAQLNLLFNYLTSKRNKDNCETFDFSNPKEIPYVTIQLPVFNEMYVMERLLDNIAKIDYPKDKLEIQVLDDSTDETVKTTHPVGGILTETTPFSQKFKPLHSMHILRSNKWAETAKGIL